MAADAMDHQDRRWTFLTNHARVLLAIARDPDARLQTIAAACLITERAVQAIIADLEQAGYLHRQRVGRRNQYTLSLDRPLRHPAETDFRLRALVDLLVDRENGKVAQPPKTASLTGVAAKGAESVHVLASEHVHEELACLIEVGHGEADVVQTGQPRD